MPDRVRKMAMNVSSTLSIWRDYGPDWVNLPSLSCSDKLAAIPGCILPNTRRINRHGWVSFAKHNTPERNSYEGIRYRSHSQSCCHWTWRRREDAAHQLASLRRRHNTTLG